MRRRPLEKPQYGKLEGLLNEVEFDFVFTENDFDDVEAEGDLGIIREAEPCERAL